MFLLSKKVKTKFYKVRFYDKLVFLNKLKMLFYNKKFSKISRNPKMEEEKTEKMFLLSIGSILYKLVMDYSFYFLHIK